MNKLWLWAALLTLAYVVVVAPTFRPAAEGRHVDVIGAGSKVSAFSLPQKPMVINVAGPLGTTVVAIDGHRARVVSSPCPNKTCVARGWLESPGDETICIPNRVVVRLK